MLRRNPLIIPTSACGGNFDSRMLDTILHVFYESDMPL
jgi:hypothetical protein